jgi:hypothetical protein
MMVAEIIYLHHAGNRIRSDNCTETPLPNKNKLTGYIDRACKGFAFFRRQGMYQGPRKARLARHAARNKTDIREAQESQIIAFADAQTETAGKPAHEQETEQTKPIVQTQTTEKSRHKSSIDKLAYCAALAPAVAAAYFSIKGMAVLFPGAIEAVVGMAVAMECTKLVAAAWLARSWRSTPVIWRMTLCVLILGLAVINAAGVYAQLVSAHLGGSRTVQTEFEVKQAEASGQIEISNQSIADLDRRIAQIDNTVEEATRRGKTNGALDLKKEQARERASLVEKRDREALTLARLKTEAAKLKATGKQIENEAAPIRYVAELLGLDTDSEKAIRWLIALMVLCCDPLAIALTAAVSCRPVLGTPGRCTAWSVFF